MEDKHIITETDIIFKDCKTGIDFEHKTIEFLQLVGLNAKKQEQMMGVLILLRI